MVSIVTAAVIVREGLVLLTLRPEGKNHAGFWEFPGGKVEEGEGPADCLRREIMEELGIEVEVGEELAVIEHDFGYERIRLMAFSCRALGEDIQNLGCEAHRWVRHEEVMGMRILPPDRKLAAIVASGRG